MKTLLVVAFLCLSSCAVTQRVPAAADPRLDSLLTAAGISPLRAGKIKIAGNVYIQTGQGNAITDNTNAGRKGSAATAPGAVASTPRPAGPPVWVYGLLVGLGLAAGFWLRGKVRIPLPF